MRWNEDALYQQFLLRDAAFDGKFITGVLTTGIYCLPSCPARRPRRENIRFFRTQDEALKTGLRPCRRCRPDFFYRGEEWHENLFEQTAQRVREDPAAFASIADLSKAAGLSRTALNDLFREHAQESPSAFLRRERLNRVKTLLQQGEKPADAAAAAGYESSSAFHEHLLARTGLTPAVYGALTAPFTLRLPPRYRVAEPIAFYGRDPENVWPTGLRKCLLICGKPAIIEIEFKDGAAICTTDATDLYAAHNAAVRILGIDSDAAAFERQFGTDPLLGEAITRQRGLRIPLTPDAWEAVSWAIMGQQISVHAATAIRRALIAAIGQRHPSGLHAHPTAEAVASLDVDKLRQLKFSGSKAEYLLAAARTDIDYKVLRDLSARHAARLLTAIRGVGTWTVQYAFLRGLGLADCLPAGDAGLAQGLERLTGTRPDEAATRAMLAKFAPYRSFATYHIWSNHAA